MTKISGKKILLTGATDGIGQATARTLIDEGHHLLLHGRNREKLNRVVNDLSNGLSGGKIDTYLSNLADLQDVQKMAKKVIDEHDKIDVLINNAGVFNLLTEDRNNRPDLRFVVNTIAPYLLTKLLMPLLPPSGRVVNLSSAALHPVDVDSLSGKTSINDDFTAYAQSKLALAMWSFHLSKAAGENAPQIITINPGSLLNTKMVREAFGSARSNVSKGADVLVKASLSSEFENSSGKFYDNDSGQFTVPHSDLLDSEKVENVSDTISTFLVSNGFEL